MNILPKKKWHVRTKENVARVRRDQKKAAEEEKRIKERAELAEQEFKVNLLRKNAEQRMETMYGVKKSADGSSENDAQLTGHSGHVNFFADLEREDRKNLGTGNIEYEMEKKKEREEYEKKIGILQYLGQGSSELTKEKPWYEKIPSKKLDTSEPKRSVNNAPATEPDKKKPVVITEKIKKEHKKHKRKHKSKKSDSKKRKKRKRYRNNSSEECSDSENAIKKRKLEKLRQERLNREAKEQKRLAELLKSEGDNGKDERNHEMVAKYNSQFNPELARQNRKR